MIDLKATMFKHKISLRCKCGYIFNEDTYEKKENISDPFTSGDTEERTIILKCPKCDQDWRKNCGVDFEVYPHIEKAILQSIT